MNVGFESHPLRPSRSFLAFLIACLPSIAMSVSPLDYQVLAGKCVDSTRAGLHAAQNATLPEATSPYDYPAKFYIGERKKDVVTVQFDMRAQLGRATPRLYTVECQWKRDGAGYKLLSNQHWPSK